MYAVYVVLIICIIIMIRRNSVFAEDFYHKNKRNYINCSVHLDDTNCLIEMIKNIIRYTLYYFKQYPDIYKKINKYNLYKTSKFENIYDNINDNLNVFPLCVIYNKCNKILLIMNHYYLGGFFFLELSRILFKGERIIPYKNNYMPLLTELMALKFLMFDFLPITLNNTLPIIDNKKNIKRVGLKIDVDILQKQYKCKAKPCIIYTVAQILFKYLDINRPLKILIPIAFENTPERYNNVGAIILNINKEDSPDIILNKLINKRYHTMVTNYLQSLSTKSSQARTCIDAIFTIGFVKNVSITNPKKITTSVSFSNIPMYGIYCVSLSLTNIANISLTICTNLFNTEKFLMEEKDSYIIF